MTIHHKKVDLDEGRCKMHCNGCMNVAWGLCWGGSRSTKPCIFPCKVAAGGDERYLLCAAGAAAIGLPFFICRIATVASSCFGCACVCVVLGCFGICGCRSHWTGCMIVVIWCCHVRRYVQVCDVMLRNAL